VSRGQGSGDRNQSMIEAWNIGKRNAIAGRAILFAMVLMFSLSCMAATYELLSGEIKITLETEAEKVTPAEDLIVKLIVDAPASLKVVLPDLRSRFTGFSLAEFFPQESLTVNERTRQSYQWRLVPEPVAPKYRLAPFAVEVVDERISPPRRQFFATKAILFPGEGNRPSVTGDPEVTLKPEWIPPTAKTVALWVVFAILGCVIVAGLIYGLLQISRRVKEYKMSPIERAMVELQRLLGRNLPAKGLYKDFYIELTMVVRRYIERTHGIHAPEQTTQEFLVAASRHPRFKHEVLVQLRTFLESADLVKFAGQEATLTMAEDATEKAKRYVEEDSRQLVTSTSAPSMK
jgi:hypothetical protein